MPSKVAARIGPIDGIAQSRGMDVAAGFSFFYAATTQMGGIFI
jgi:hypothetical protein